MRYFRNSDYWLKADPATSPRTWVRACKTGWPYLTQRDLWSLLLSKTKLITEIDKFKKGQKSQLPRKAHLMPSLNANFSDVWFWKPISILMFLSMEMLLVSNGIRNFTELYWWLGFSVIVSTRDYFMRKTPFQKSRYHQLPSRKCQTPPNLKVNREKEKRVWLQRDLNPGLLIYSQLCYPLYHEFLDGGNLWEQKI